MGDSDVYRQISDGEIRAGGWDHELAEAERVSPKHRVNIYVEADQWIVLQGLSGRTGAPIAELVRRAIDEYVARHLTREDIQTLLRQRRREREGEDRPESD